MVSIQNTQFSLSREILARNLAFFFFHSEDDSMWKVYGKINSNFKLLFSYLFCLI